MVERGWREQALVGRVPRVPHPTLVHYMYAGPFGRDLDIMRGAGLRARGPRLLSRSPRPGWQRCELTILSVKVLPLYVTVLPLYVTVLPLYITVLPLPRGCVWWPHA